MKRYWIDLRCQVAPRQGSITPEALDVHLDDLMDALMDEPDAVDPDLTATLTTGEVTISLGVDAASNSEALTRAMGITHSAIHKIGAAFGTETPPHEGELGFHENFDARVRTTSAATCP
ncbi:hypothetical protein [Actinosynnema mirum]|uniref:Uncharacterized protein n=1 Tax=Actinosynnema mirum (strain ATCC 29888 / DSM 43827 / JCM 3225 / NBRC 14064 / NCIMB 13271 / NRRL B-12336 / IMRU 3971 / 101) TaxID=446462 RepID=C6WJ80_ACTMD|nr:hypothetical protein [Actinosynnema mirum]ACU40156.1 hypothetical protein Amir_6354 [Actinosynnema mirum DSM 43827]